MEKIILEYRDKNGVVVKPGDVIKFDGDGMTEKVYLAEGTPDYYDLGINASNELWLENHPWCDRELYPLSNFDSDSYEVIGHEEV